MSTMTIQIEPDTYFTCLAILRERQKAKPDLRVVGAMVDLHQAALREVDREIEAVSEPNLTPAFHRKQAG